MRFLALIIALAAVPAMAAEYPLWNGEPIEEYAKKVNLPPTKTLDLGNGVTMDFVLIPAGKFTMGTKEPRPVDEEYFAMQKWAGQAALALSMGVLLAMLAFVVTRAVREKHRPQLSLARLLALSVIAGIGLLGGLHWHFSAQAFVGARREYQEALERYRSWDNDELPMRGEEKPAHEVTLTEPYYMGKFEVTQEQYQHVTGTNPSNFRGRYLPVECVSWNSAQEFCRKVSERTRVSLRLPREAEWEYACRAGTKTACYTGDSAADLDRSAWYGGNSGGTPHPVGQKTPNAWNLHDMHGNVWEWCADWYGDYGEEATLDPQGPAQGLGRTRRGGSWNGTSGYCRSARRSWNGPEFRNYRIGFRVVAQAPRAP